MTVTKASSVDGGVWVGAGTACINIEVWADDLHSEYWVYLYQNDRYVYPLISGCSPPAELESSEAAANRNWWINWRVRTWQDGCTINHVTDWNNGIPATSPYYSGAWMASHATPTTVSCSGEGTNGGPAKCLPTDAPGIPYLETPTILGAVGSGASGNFVVGAN